MKALIVLLTMIMTTFNNSTYKIDFGTNRDGQDWMVLMMMLWEADLTQQLN